MTIQVCNAPLSHNEADFGVARCANPLPCSTHLNLVVESSLVKVRLLYRAATVAGCEELAAVLLQDTLVGDMEHPLNTVTGMLLARIAQLSDWVSDLQQGCYVNCVYCGHRYGPEDGTLVAMADVLKEHISVCPDHPLAAALEEIKRLRQSLGEVLRHECASIQPQAN